MDILKILLIIGLSLEFIFVAFVAYVYITNTKRHDTMREKSLEVLIPLIETSVTREHRKYENKIIFRSVEEVKSYKEKLIDNLMPTLISELSKGTEFNINYVDYEEIKFRLTAYVFNNLRISVTKSRTVSVKVPKEMADGMRERHNNTVDLGDSIENFYNV